MWLFLFLNKFDSMYMIVAEGFQSQNFQLVVTVIRYRKAMGKWGHA